MGTYVRVAPSSSRVSGDPHLDSEKFENLEDA